MKAAIVAQAGSLPVYSDFPEPAPSSGECSIAVSAAALSPVVKARVSGAHYSARGRLPLCRGHRWRRTARRWPPRLLHPAEGALRQHGGTGRRSCIALRARARRAGRHRRRRDRQSRPVVMGRSQGTRQIGVRRNRADQRRDRDVRPPRRSDRETPGRRENHRHRPQCLSPAIAEGDRRRRDHSPWRRYRMRSMAPSRSISRPASTSCSIICGAKAPSDLLIAGAKAGKDGVPIRFVQVGNASGANITLPASALRSVPIELMGSGLGSVPFDRIVGSDCGTAAGRRRRWLSNCHQNRSLVRSRTGMARRGLQSAHRICGWRDRR